MFEKTIWDKLLEGIFENSEISRVKRGKFQITRVIYRKNCRTKHVVTGQSQQTNKHFVVKLIAFNSGQLQISKRAITKQRANTK